jgi:N-acetyl-alpha-D-glucosaminyl L-malate synthase BshA
MIAAREGELSNGSRPGPRLAIGIMCNSQLGGSVRIPTELACELARRGHRVHVFTRSIPPGLEDPPAGLRLHCARTSPEGLQPGALYTEWPPWEYDEHLAHLTRVASRERLDVLHYHYADPFAYLAVAARRRMGGRGPAIVGTLHGTDVTTSGTDPVKGPHLRAALCEADALTTVSDFFAQLIPHVFDLAGRPEVIPNFVDVSRFHPGNGRSPPDAAPIIIHVSNFRRVKDPLSAARIFLRIRAHRPARLWMVGDGPERALTEALLRESPYFADVRFWGMRADVAALLRRAALLLVTSQSESFCLAALEAMATGRPVLATRVGGLPEVVADGQTGLLFDLGEEARAGALAIALLADPVRYRAMSAAAVRRAADFEQGAVVAQYERLYARLVAQRLGRRGEIVHAHPR